MMIFHSFLYVYQRVPPEKSHQESKGWISSQNGEMLRRNFRPTGEILEDCFANIVANLIDSEK